jgi:hypothetical protein
MGWMLGIAFKNHLNHFEFFFALWEISWALFGSRNLHRFEIILGHQSPKTM